MLFQELPEGAIWILALLSGLRNKLQTWLRWLWRRLAAAAPVRLLAQELPYATGKDVKRKKKKIFHSIFFLELVNDCPFIVHATRPYDSKCLLFMGPHSQLDIVAL